MTSYKTVTKIIIPVFLTKHNPFNVKKGRKFPIYVIIAQAFEGFFVDYLS